MRSVRAVENPDAYKEDLIQWRLSSFDYGGPWGVAALQECNWQKHISEHLKSYETMTWHQVLGASGGKKKGTNNHPLPISDLSKKAQSRLAEIGREDIDEIFSIRLEAKVRLYGIRQGAVFYFLWVDPWHDNERKAVCPSLKK